MARVSERDLWSALGDLPTGWRSTSELYPVYVAWAERNNRKPEHVNSFALGLKAACQERRKRDKVWEWLTLQTQESDMTVKCQDSLSGRQARDVLRPRKLVS